MTHVFWGHPLKEKGGNPFLEEKKIDFDKKKSKKILGDKMREQRGEKWKIAHIFWDMPPPTQYKKGEESIFEGIFRFWRKIFWKKKLGE